MSDFVQHPASYRDPSGFIFMHAGKYYRQVNKSYAGHYALLKESGLYDLLIKKQQLLQHTELQENLTGSEDWLLTLLPQQMSFISYPYEWCFEQWKEAALLTLDIMSTAMEHGMILKDATPFNIQFADNRPVLIDSLSFEKYDESKPWVAYHQFAACFIAPLMIARYHSQALLRLFQVYPDGIPLDIAVNMLPAKAKLNLDVWLHMLLPARMSKKQSTAPGPTASFSRQKLQHIIDSLRSLINGLKLPVKKSTWNNYYEETVLSNEYVSEKKALISDWLKEIPASTVLDLGTNTGLFAIMTAALGKFTIAVDADVACIEALYQNCREKKIKNLLPLYVDITNPTPAIGWDNAERTRFADRAKTGLCMALALVHHLAIGKNTSFEQMAKTFSELSPSLIIEFVPKSDPKVALLLQNREDIFTHYDEAHFQQAFEQHYTILKKQALVHTGRSIFLMKRKEG